MKSRRLLAILGGLVLVMAACGPAATSTPTATPRPVATPTTARAATPTPTRAPTPTATPMGKYGGTLKLAFDREARGWDPFRITTADLHPWVAWDYARLLRYNADPDLGCSYFPPVPELAESWKWLDDRTLQFNLRQGVKWPNVAPVNGREFVADDVVYSMNVLWPKSRYPAYYMKAGEMQPAEAVDSHTVKLRFKKPVAAFINGPPAFWWGIIAAPEVFGPDNEIKFAEENIGLGPYILKEYVPGTSVRHERNPNYWRQGLPYIDAVEYSIIPDMSTQQAAIIGGRIDAVPHPQPNPPVQERLSREPGINVYACPWPIFYRFIMTREEGSPFKDVRVRRAISMAIDREGLNQSAYLGLGFPNELVVSSAYGEYALTRDKLPAELRKYVEYHPNEAKRLLAEAGYPNGFSTKMYATPKYGPVHMAVAEALVDLLGRINIKLELEPLEYGRWAETVIAKKFTGTAVGWGGGNSVHDSVNTPHCGGPKNYSEGCSPELDALIDEYMRTGDIETAHKAQELAISQMQGVPLPAPPFSGYFRDAVKNVAFKPHYVTSVDYLLYSWLER